MPQACKICRHSMRQAIDAVLLKGRPSLRMIGTQYGVSKDSLLRHYRAHIPGTSDGVEENEARQIDEIAEHEKEPEARQVAELVEQKKEADVDARYLAFVDRWRGNLWIRVEMMADWPYEREELEDLLDEAIRRGDLWTVGRFCGPAIRTLARWRA